MIEKTKRRKKMYNRKRIKDFLIDDLQKLDDLITNIETNDIYNGFDNEKHKVNCEKLRDFHSYWSTHSKQI